VIGLLVLLIPALAGLAMQRGVWRAAQLLKLDAKIDEFQEQNVDAFGVAKLIQLPDDWCALFKDRASIDLDDAIRDRRRLMKLITDPEKLLVEFTPNFDYQVAERAKRPELLAKMAVTILDQPKLLAEIDALRVEEEAA